MLECAFRFLKAKANKSLVAGGFAASGRGQKGAGRRRRRRVKVSP